MNKTKKIIKERDLESLSLYKEYFSKKPDLRLVFLELTDCCNLKCRHCGSLCDATKANFINTELIIQKIDEIANDFKDKNFMFVLTGGEPLLHPNFEAIANAINKNSIPWGMTTNGTLIDKGKAFGLKELKIASITLSLDGPKDDHEWLRNVDGCYGKTIEAIKNLKDAGLVVQVTSVINKKTINKLDELYMIVKNNNVDSWKIVNTEPIGRALENNDLFLTKEEIRQLLDFIKDKRFDHDNEIDICYGCSHYLSFDYEREVRDFYFECGAGTHVLSITATGDIISCLDIERRKELIQGNIKTDRVSDIWNNKFEIFRENRTHKSNKCSNCDENAYCRADSMHTWDFENNEPLLCLKEIL